MKKFLLSVGIMALAMTATAGEATFNFAEEDYGLERKSGNVSDGYLEDGQKVTTGGATITFNGSGNSWRLWTDGLREYYKNNPSFTVTANNGQNVTKVSWTGKSGLKFALDGTETEIDTWTGSQESVKFINLSTNNLALITVTIEYEGEAVEPDPDPTPETPETIYNEPFATADALDNFTIDEELSEGLNYVWAIDTNYKYLKGSAYVGGNKQASSWLISPVVDLATYTDVTLSFTHTINYMNGNACEDFCQLYVGEAETSTSTWTNLSSEITYPAGNNWTFVNSGDVSLKDFEGKKIQFGFYYQSTTAVAPTWEIKNLVISGWNESSSVISNFDENIDAPVEFYNLNGVRVNNPENGVFIRRQGNKTSKVVIR